MPQNDKHAGEVADNSDQPAAGVVQEHRSSSTSTPPQESPGKAITQEANGIPSDEAHNAKTRQKAPTDAELPRLVAYFEISIMTIVTIGLLWVGTVLLYYIAGGIVAFLGFLVSSIITLSTFIGVFWPVFIKNVWSFLRNRHTKRWHIFRRVVFISLLIALLVFLGLIRWEFDPYHHIAWPALNDQLSSNDNYWHGSESKNQTYGFCSFEQGSYHVTAYSRYFYYCIATGTDYTNFIYEVQMTFVKNDACGGLVFRADYDNNKVYVFEICKDESYCLFRYDGAGLPHPVIGCYGNKGNLPEILNKTTGTTKPITLAVVARGDQFEIWVNNDELDVGFDFSSAELKEGQIGVAADSPGTQISEVAFSNARVWTLYGT